MKLIDDPEYEWRDFVQVGDILITPSGDHRLVRTVKYWPEDSRYQHRRGRLCSVGLAIRNCSWTHRGNTCINRSDLRTRKFKPTGLKAEALVDCSKLTCCDVKGLL